MYIAITATNTFLGYLAPEKNHDDITFQRFLFLMSICEINSVLPLRTSNAELLCFVCYHHILLLNQQPICLWFETSRRYVHVSVTVMMFQDWYCMMTSSNGNVLRVTGHLCGEFTGPGEFPAQRPVTRSFGVFSDLRLNKRLSKQSWGWWFETPSSPLWRPCNDHKQPIA